MGRIFKANGLNTSMPVYVTRKTGDGVVASYWLSLWMTTLAMLVVWINVVVWGFIGLYEAARVFV